MQTTFKNFSLVHREDDDGVVHYAHRRTSILSLCTDQTDVRKQPWVRFAREGEVNAVVTCLFCLVWEPPW